MFYLNAKVYFDGSHYIAIPHTVRPYRERRKRREENIIVPQKNGAIDALNNKDNTLVERITTKKQLFDEVYAETVYMKKSERQEKIMETLLPHFSDEEKAREYMRENVARKKRNMTARRIRLMRKINLQEFNYFVTFTYDGKIHTEESFRKKLRNTLSHLSSRKGWRYIGVWERSPEKERLHFHGVFYIPGGTMPGSIEEISGYSFTNHKRQTTKQNTYFAYEFGRNDFSEIERKTDLHDSVQYLLKYIEKSGEKLVYSKGLCQYFISDIREEDVICRVGVDDRKLLLFDDFLCIDEGEIIGQVSKETIRLMRMRN